VKDTSLLHDLTSNLQMTLNVKKNMIPLAIWFSITGQWARNPRSSKRYSDICGDDKSIVYKYTCLWVCYSHFTL